MIRFLDSLSDNDLRKIRRCSCIRWFRPMLATRSHEPFSNPGWIFERALGGLRCIALRDSRGIRLRSGDNEEIGRSFPQIVDALSGQSAKTFAVDGEIVGSGPGAALYLYDVLQVDGYDVSRLGLGQRKRLLKTHFSFGGVLRYTPYRNGAGEDLFAKACRNGWAGVIAKKRSTPYRHDRSPFWLEFACPG